MQRSSRFERNIDCFLISRIEGTCDISVRKERMKAAGEKVDIIFREVKF